MPATAEQQAIHRPVFPHADVSYLQDRPDSLTATAESDYTDGMPAQMRPELPGYNSGILFIIIGMLLLVIANLQQVSRFFKTLMYDLHTVRRHSNVFDEHTVSETRLLAVLIVQLCVCEGILMSAAFGEYTSPIPPSRLLTVYAVMAGLAMVYYLWQVIAYNVIGYTFSDKEDTRQWLRGFKASQALLGCALLPPTLALLFYQSLTIYLITIGVTLYVIFRIIFIIKGIRIFYHNFYSLVYFILYLCSVEIIPLMIVYGNALLLCRKLIR